VFDLAFPDPIVGDGQIARRFVALHRDAEREASTLEREDELLSFLEDLAAASPGRRRHTRREARNAPGVRRASDHLRGEVARNVTSMSSPSSSAPASTYSFASSRTRSACHPTASR
jgi:hypothetical protein